MTADERAALKPKLQEALDALIAEDAPTDVSTDAEGTRIVTVGGLPCPCGGTHVAIRWRHRRRDDRGRSRRRAAASPRRCACRTA